MKMKRCTAAILLMLAIQTLIAGRLSAAVADDTIRLPSQGLADEIVTATREKTRPWKCCDKTFCNRRMPPGCRCMDPVEQCDDACSRCETSLSDPSKLVCMDRYTGDPGPSCTEDGNGVADDISTGSKKTMVDSEAARPWTCCDDTLCTFSFPPVCFCQDKLKKCAKTCKSCEKLDGASPRFVCRDSYFGWPGPTCTKGVATTGEGPRVAAQKATAAVAVAATETARPWRCCNRPAPTSYNPPTWRCLDSLDGGCWSTCKRCVQSVFDPDSHECLDGHVGDPGPRCSGLLDTMLLNSNGHISTGKAEAAASEKSVVVVGVEDQARPWKCCDDSLCTRSAPPTCVCRDKVKKCAKGCKLCEKAGGASSRHVCRDVFFGWSPRCTDPVAADVAPKN